MFSITDKIDGLTRDDIKSAVMLLVLIIALFFLSGCDNNDKQPNPSGVFETTEIDISALIAARALDIKVELGDAVKEGDTLVVLDTELLQLQRKQTATRFAQIKANRNILNDKLAGAQSSFELAERTYSRIKNLQESGSATEQQLDEARTGMDNTQQGVNAINHQLEALDAEAAVLQATLNTMDRQIAEGILISPVNGNVILKRLEKGESTTPGAVCLRIADLSSLELRFYLDEMDLDKIKLNQELEVAVDAIEGRTLKGKVTWISAESEFTPKNVQTRDARAQLVYAIKLKVQNPDGLLKIGMPAEVVMN